MGRSLSPALGTGLIPCGLMLTSDHRLFIPTQTNTRRMYSVLYVLEFALFVAHTDLILAHVRSSKHTGITTWQNDDDGTRKSSQVSESTTYVYVYIQSSSTMLLGTKLYRGKQTLASSCSL